jgi:hypothetical protein
VLFVFGHRFGGLAIRRSVAPTGAWAGPFKAIYRAYHQQHYRLNASIARREDRSMLTTRQSLFIFLATMLMIAASALIVERYFPSHAASHPPIALKPTDTNTCNNCS